MHRAVLYFIARIMNINNWASAADKVGVDLVRSGADLGWNVDVVYRF